MRKARLLVLFAIHPRGEIIDLRDGLLRCSRQAALQVGKVFKDDVVAIEPGVIGRVMCFWGFGSSVMAQVAVHRLLGNNLWSTLNACQDFVCVSRIAASCMWADADPPHIKVITPVQWRLLR